MTTLARCDRVANRLNQFDPSHVPLVTYFEHPAHDLTPKAKTILVKTDQVADEVGLDDGGD